MQQFQEFITEAFTKQHYEAIADEVKTLVDLFEDNSGDIDAVQAFAERLATVFKNDNPRFDKQRFLKACGF